MSSTNRACNPRHANDYYCTNPDDITTFLIAMEEDQPAWIVPGDVILDPSAGGDPENEMSYPKALIGMYADITIKTIDIREDSLAETKADYLKTKLNYRPRAIITNPPFNLATEFIDKALLDVIPGGWVIMLQRLNFLGSAKRLEWWKKMMPNKIYVHSDRMGFITKYADRIGSEEAAAKGEIFKSQYGRRDSIEYAHFAWQTEIIQNRKRSNYADLRVI